MNTLSTRLNSRKHLRNSEKFLHAFIHSRSIYYLSFNIKRRLTSILLKFTNDCISSKMKSCGFKSQSPLIISRSKTKLTLYLDDLPKSATIPTNIDNQKKGPEWDSSIGKVVRQAQIDYPNCVILTRVGQFWELYFEQAKEIAPLLDIKLTKKKFGQEYFAFAGFPVQHLDRYLATLVNVHGLPVAICEEFLNDEVNEDKLKFKRRITRIITPGTLIDESFLPYDQNNFLLALSLDEKTNLVGLAWIDITTGLFFMQRSNLESISGDLMRIRPSEIVLCDNYHNVENHDIWQYVDSRKYIISYEPSNSFNSKLSQSWTYDSQVDYDINQMFSSDELKASAALLSYINKNLVGRTLKIQSPISINLNDTMIIDATTLRSLEITISMRDNTKRGSLLHAIRRTKTASGARTLDRWLCFPTTSINIINNRLNLVEYFCKNTHLTSDIRQILENCDDTQRTSQKITFTHCNPDDFLKLKHTLESMLSIKYRLQSELYTIPDASMKTLVERIQPQNDLINIISEAIDEDVLIKMKETRQYNPDGSIISGINTDIEEAENIDLDTNFEGCNDEPVAKKKTTKKRKKIGQNSESSTFEEDFASIVKNDNWVIKKEFSPRLLQLHEQLEVKYRDMIELRNRWKVKLKLRSHPSFGFIVAIKRVQNNKDVERILNATRIHHFKHRKLFIIQKWTHLGGQIEDIKSNIREEETRIFQLIQKKIVEEWDLTVQNSRVVDELDIVSSFAVLAREQNFVRPILNYGNSHKIVGGRHPVVEAGLQLKGRQFIKNDCYVGDKKRLPNMGGKSTYLRQNAIISILAQIGSFVPADHAEIGIVDQILSRVGASDNLYQDQSTFMVEMIETAHILRNATSRSFVIMDEIGRGTATLDGIAISFATLYQLHYINRCRTLFATHFHELPNLIVNFENVACYCTDIQENKDGSFYYLHQIKEGVNRNSAALKAAQLAGVPPSVLIVAKNTLKYLQDHSKPINLDSYFQSEIEKSIYNDLPEV
ncbi:14117_t:CDS:10 [Cetraspora pellucida]|uniref:14117_t:CDS:1 n=1 Tax=Cetraspora pellucida TaxID=1433469 RepID=A0A9N8W8F1_9GLOM|nr:14117_t:CDS:10 [Cetraspora pellucida]